MADIVNDRVNTAQAELLKRAKKLESIVKQARGRRPNPAFEEGARLLNDMIQSQSKLYDTAVFSTPKTSLEQMRNLNLMTGGMDKTVQQGIKSTTDYIDMMLDTLAQMSR